jgi:hypothetical protein
MKLVLNTIGSRYGSIDALNANFEAIQDAFDNTLSLDGTVPNSLGASLDANSQRIINLPVPVDGSDAATKLYVDTATAIVTSYLDEIAIVSNNIADVVKVADNIDVIVDNIGAIENTGNAITEIIGVANNIGSVQLVGLDLNGAFEQGVIYDFGAITDPAIGPATPTTSSIVKVADDIDSVVLVATNIADVIDLADNLTELLLADTYAAAALASATAADVSSDAAAISATAADGSADAASASEIAAELAETNAELAEVNAETARGLAVDAQLAAEAALASTLLAFDSFDDRYLGAKTSDPTLDNDGNPLVAGQLYFNSVSGFMKVYTGTIWVDAYAEGTTFLAKAENLSDLPNKATARTNLGLGTAATTNATAYATAAQGVLADSATQPEDLGDLALLDTVGTIYITNNAVTVDKLAATLDYGSIV